MVSRHEPLAAWPTSAEPRPTPCTLRAAIQNANASPGADVINLAAGTYTLTIPGVGENAAAAGDLDITQKGLAITADPRTKTYGDTVTFCWLGATCDPAGTFALDPLCAVITERCATFFPSAFTFDDPPLNLQQSLHVWETTPFC